MRARSLLVCAAIAGGGMAQKFAYAKDCDSNIQKRITKGIADAVGFAKKAQEVLNSHGNDAQVQELCKAVLDDGQKYEQNMQGFKASLDGISKYATAPDGSGADSDAWRKGMSNKDLEVHCSKDQVGPHKVFPHTYVVKPLKDRMIDEDTYNKIVNCHDPNYKPPPDEDGDTLAFVMSSDEFDQQGYENAKKATGSMGRPTPKRKFFYDEHDDLANILNVCESAIKEQDANDWKSLDPDDLKKVMDPDWIKANTDDKSNYTPVDAIRPFGIIILHELSHTNLGGRADDINEDDKLNGADNCYSWKCVTKLKREDNADSVAFLAFALNLWDMGYLVDNDGKLKKK